MDEWSKRVAHISEEIEGHRTGERGDTWYTGFFSGFVEGAADLEAIGDDEFEDLPLEAAVAWGRERADVVIVEIGGFDAPFSAGRAERAAAGPGRRPTRQRLFGVARRTRRGRTAEATRRRRYGAPRWS